MSFGKDASIKESMSEAVEGGAGLAWRLLATLEGGSLLLATSALLAYTVRNKIAHRNRPLTDVRSVLVTNTTNLLGRELKRLLEAHGCIVSDATSVAMSGAASRDAKVDALVVVGAEPKEDGLDGVAGLVNEDVYDNLKLLESLSARVRRGGRVAWACAGASVGTFGGAGAAFDQVLHASLHHAAKLCHAEPIWVGRCETAEQTAERVTAALMPLATTRNSSWFSVRDAAHKVGEYLCRWLKIVT